MIEKVLIENSNGNKELPLALMIGFITHYQVCVDMKFHAVVRIIENMNIYL